MRILNSDLLSLNKSHHYGSWFERKRNILEILLQYFQRFLPMENRQFFKSKIHRPLRNIEYNALYLIKERHLLSQILFSKPMGIIKQTPFEATKI